MGLGMAAVAAMQLNASALQFGLTGEFSNGTAPTGATPWGTVNLTDTGKGVLVTFDVGNNNIGKLSEWYLNYDPTKDVSKLRFTAVNTWDVLAWGADTGVNAFKADGDGTYDIRFQFSTVFNSFSTGDTLSFLVTSKDGADLNPDDFNFVSVGGAKGSFHTAAHVLDLFGTCGSGWVGDPTSSSNTDGVPDGFWTVTLLGMGIVTIEFLRRKFRKAEAQQ
jgi:hypothetical protein